MVREAQHQLINDVCVVKAKVGDQLIVTVWTFIY